MIPQLVCILGGECSGKTTLARALAQELSSLWVPEYLREFCQAQGRAPLRDEQGLIMRTQFEREEQALAQAQQSGMSYVFCDTSPLLTAAYSTYYFSDESLLASAHAVQGRYALSLVLKPDVTWQPDGTLRDGEAARTAIHARLLHELQSAFFPHIEVGGKGELRLASALLAVGTLSC
jgi:nicotinamide riboside kinase